MRSKVLALIVSLSLMLSFPLTAWGDALPAADAQAASQGRTVVVGYIDYAGMIEQGQDGTFSGYGVDYLDEISKITGWNVEYKQVNWADTVGVYDETTGQRTACALQDGSVDFVIHAQKTDDRERDYLFAKYPTGYESTVVYAQADREGVYYDDPQGLDGMRVGLLTGSFQATQFLQYASDQGISITQVDYPSDTAMREGLAAGEVDAIVTGSLAYYDDFKVILKVDAEPFYFMTAPANADLLSQLDDAMSQITIAEPAFQGTLMEKYYSSATSNSTPLLTRVEMEYIQSAGTITVGQPPSRQPLSSYDSATGQLLGVNEDVMDEISRVSGLSFKYVPLAAGQKAVDALKGGTCDLVAGVSGNAANRNNPDLTLSNSFMTASIIPVVRNGEQFDPEGDVTIALPASYAALTSFIAKQYPTFQIKTYTTNEECLQALVAGQVDAFMQNEYVLRYLLQSPRYSTLQALNAYSIEEDNVIMGLSETTSPVLMSIINKSISAIPDSTFSRIVVSQTVANAYQYTPEDFFYAYRTPLTVGIIALVLVLGLCVIIMVSRQRHSRTLEAKNRQLAESMRVAQTASTAKTDFLAQMSHEIRTPMNAIIGMTAIAKTDVGDDHRVTDDLNKIDASSKMLLTLINDILDMTAIENKKMKIDNAPFDFKQLISSISTIYYAQCKQKRIQFAVRMYGDIDEQLVGDSLRVNQILLNLLSNAVKFTPAQGRIDLSIREMRRTDDQVFIRFVVSDTGCGMSPDMVERLFKPFEQESASTARKHGGSGLGLSIAKNLAGMMHGSISVDSTKDVGTAFTVDIPFGLSEDAEAVRKSATLVSGSMRALVIDDDEDALRYTSSILDRVGIDHTCSQDGEEALELMGEAEDEENPYTLCFVDWKMPNMNGLELTREIRQVFGDDAVIIIVSAYDLDEVEADGRKAGANYFLSKPLFQSSVFDMLTMINGGGSATLTADQSQFKFEGHRVLVAEDVALNMEVAVRLLGLANVQAECAEDGVEAVRMFGDSQPGYYDLILMDINMPNMDGYEATHAIRHMEREDARTIPIFAMTANAFSEDVSKSLSSGMNGHIAKPIDTQVLYSTLATVFEGTGDSE